jgi:asparagine synthase (glutamine-hydrolysing)
MWFSPDGKIALGHRRLAIIDLSERAAQPMADADGRYVITYNGEIYNYLEIRDELKSLGVIFRSDSDTEVILEAYKQWNEACLNHFNGMFAFALYDSVDEKLFCARDRFAEKPFLFSKGKDFFAFASEYKALLQLKEIPLDYDEFRLLQGLHNPSTGLDADNETVFCAIKQLRPAEKLTLDVRTLEHRISRYWDVQNDPEVVRFSEKEAFERFRELLTDSVRIRMRSDVPVGSCLSGGLDSSAIVCIARRLLGDDAEYHTFTGRFPGTPADEWDYAKEVVSDSRVVSHVVEPTGERFVEELPDFMWYNELPVGSSSQYAQWCVFRLAKDCGITVLLDGQGGDEILGGYEQYFQYYVASLKEAGETARLEKEVSEISRRYPLALVPPLRSMRDRVPFSIRHTVARLTGKGTNLLYGIRLDVANRLKEANELVQDRRFNPLTNALYQDSFGKYLTTLLRYGDRNSMAHSREVRLPFCDYRLAEFVFSLPSWYLMGGIQTKRILRESMRGILPEKIRLRWRKQGFLPPQHVWFRGALLHKVRSIIEEPGFERSSIWLGAWWRKLLRRIEDGDSHLGWALWQPLMMEAWKRYFVTRIALRSASISVSS